MCKPLYVVTKEKGQMPLLTDRALMKVETVLYRYKKTVIKMWKQACNALSTLPPRTQPLLSLFPFKTPVLGKWLANTTLLVSMLFSLIWNVCDCYDYSNHHCGRNSPPPPEQMWTIVFCIMYTSVKTVRLIGTRETSHCPKYILIKKQLRHCQQPYPLSDPKMFLRSSFKLRLRRAIETAIALSVIGAYVFALMTRTW